MRSNRTWVFLFYLFATFLISTVCTLAVREVFSLFNVTDVILGNLFLYKKLTLACLMGVSLSIAVLGYVIFLNQALNNFVWQCIEQLSKVAWSSVHEIKKSTTIVVVICVIASIILGFFDFVFGWLSSKNFFLG